MQMRISLTTVSAKQSGTLTEAEKAQEKAVKSIKMVRPTHSTEQELINESKRT